MIGAVGESLGVVDRLPPTGYAENLGLRRRCCRRGGGGRGVSLVMAMPPDAKEPLLQITVGGERPRLHNAIDAPVDHDRDMIRDRGRNADILLDNQNRDVFFMREADEKVAHLRDNHRGEPFGRLVHDQQARIAEERAGDRQHLLLAARKLAAPVPAPLGKTREGRIDPLDRPRAFDACAQAKRLVDRETGPETAPLRNVADASPDDLMRLEAHKFAAFKADRP